MTPTTAKVALLGLPGTGKSTFLGALWALIEDADFPEISEASFEGDRAYVQALSRTVVAAKALDRTSVSSDQGLTATLAFEGGAAVELSLDDLSGEQLRELVEERHWLPLLRGAIQGLHGILLFVHPNEVRRPEPLRVATPEASGKSPDSQSEGSLMFSAKDASTIAKLVDALENILGESHDLGRLRVAVIVSAFDLERTRTPGEWLTSRLPGLRSFLDVNSERLDWAVFGVSAQGGRFPQEREAVLEKGDLRERCFATNENGDVVPLSEPLRWAVEWR